MPKKSKLDRKQVLKAVRDHDGNITRAAASLGVSRTTFSKRYHNIKSGRTTENYNARVKRNVSESPEELEVPEGETETIRFSHKGDDLIDFVCLMKKRIPAEEIAEEAGYSHKKWRVISSEINQWQVAGKKRNGQEKETKRWLPEDLWKEQLYQIKFKLQRIAPKFVQDAVERLMADWAGPLKAPTIKRRKTLDRPHLLEISLFDAHFGKLAWAEETGSDYNLKIAENIYLNAVDDLLDRSGVFNIERIVYPVGQDFFNVDNWKGETANGTLVESTDDRFTKIFTVGVEAIKLSVMRAREIAPVRILWSPGNHDRSTSWYLCKAIQQYCEGAKISDVTFDLGPNQRKYELFGNTLLGFTHACDERIADLPLTMATEEKRMWAEADYHAWHVGHYHKKKQVKYVAGDTFNGVSVTILPSLTATDSWHYRNGWVKPHQAAEAYLWSKDKGLSNFMVHTI